MWMLVMLSNYKVTVIEQADLLSSRPARAVQGDLVSEKKKHPQIIQLW